MLSLGSFRSATSDGTEPATPAPFGRLGRFASFPWNTLVVGVIFFAFLVLMPVSIVDALAAADGNWSAKPWPNSRWMSDATISQSAFAAVTAMILAAAGEIAAIRMFVGEVRHWRSRGRSVAESDSVSGS